MDHIDVCEVNLMHSPICDIIDLEDGLRTVRKTLRKAYNAIDPGDQGSARALLRQADQEALDALSKSCPDFDEADFVGLDGNPIEPSCFKRRNPRKVK